MTVQRKTFPVELKAGEKGQVEALVSMFGNVDLGGDKVMPGAFAASIARWKSSGDPVPVVFSHKWDDPWAHIGEVTGLEETEQGLKASYRLDVDDNPLAAHIHRLMKRRSLKEHSFAYTVAKSKTGEDGANELHELDIIEVGPTLKGMNPDTELLSVKAAAWDALESERDGQKTVGQLTYDELSALVTDTVTQVLSAKTVETQENEKPVEAGDVKSDEDEGGTASDPELLSLQRQINQLRS
jgi:uncharacterized protein